MLQNLKSLVHLNLSMIDSVDVGVIRALSNCKSLHSLSLNGCATLSEKALGEIVALAKLEDLNLSWVHSLP